MSNGKLCLNGCFTFKPFSEFAQNTRSPDGYMARCRSCEADRISVRKHGLTVRQKRLIAEHQGGCRICGRPDPGAKGWVVDHDHGCCPRDSSCAECRRGVLCSWCNTALGYAQDSANILRAMADYLDSGERLAIPTQLTDSLDWVLRTDRDGRTDGESSQPDNYLSTNVPRARKP